MKVLLINPNRFKSPPVPPIGLEHLAASLEMAGHDAYILDLCFSREPIADLDKAMVSFHPEVVGVTVRNVDTVLFRTNEFFLDEIREIIEYVKSRYEVKVIIGGTGVSANPEEILKYMNADYAVCGPAEDVINEVLDKIRFPEKTAPVRRSEYRYDIFCPRKLGKIDYGKYYDLGGVAGFETHKGCGSSCVYCLEANSLVSFKDYRDVIDEIRSIVDSGYNRFHLCDSEFNEDLDYCIDFCSALQNADLHIDWALYMKPVNYSKKLLHLMKKTGVSLIKLTVDSWKKCPLYYTDIEKIIFMAKSCGLNIVVDFLTGFPYEDEDTLKRYLDMFRRVQPDSVGINTYLRLYKSLQITKVIVGDPELRRNLIGNTGNDAFIKPVFYNHVSTERLNELIAGDRMFRIQGL